MAGTTISLKFLSGTDRKPQRYEQKVSLRTFQRTHELTMNSWGVQISDEEE